MTRLFAFVALMLSLAACDEFRDLEQPPEPMGRFLLGHNIVVSNDPQVGALSRKASDDEWIASLTEAVDERFRRYEGDQFYHIAIKVEGYVLAEPGIPLVASPKSVLLIAVTLWDDAREAKINEEPKGFTVFERLSGETFISSGLTQTKEIQMRNLSRNAAYQIHQWMLENKQWFGEAPPEATTETTDEIPETIVEDPLPEETEEATG
jgi:hypothetical protein